MRAGRVGKKMRDAVFLASLLCFVYRKSAVELTLPTPYFYNRRGQSDKVTVCPLQNGHTETKYDPRMWGVEVA